MSKLFDDASLAMIPSAYKDGKLYSIRPTDGSGDFTFSRGSNLAATRVDVNGLIEKGRENLLVQSNNFSSGSWPIVNATITGGQSGYDGSNDAWLLSATNNYANVYQTISKTGVLTFSCYAKAGTSDWMMLRLNGSSNNLIYFDVANGVLGTIVSSNYIDSNIEALANGWFRLSITINQTSYSGSNIYVAAADNDLITTNETIYIQDAQLEAGLVATDYIETGASTAQAGILEDMPRLDYSGSCPALLLEPQRTNLVINSEYANSTNWSNGGTTYSNNQATSPEGVDNAIKLIEDNSTSFHYLGSDISGVTTAGTYSISGFIKKGTRRYGGLRAVTNGYVNRYFVLVDLDDGSVVDTHTQGSGVTWSYDVQDYGSGWYRIEISGAHTSGTIGGTFSPSDTDSPTYFGGLPDYDGSTGEHIFCYGLQAELGSYPTSYIPTYGSSVTRSWDDNTASFADIESEGTMFGEVEVIDTGAFGTPMALSINDATTNFVLVYKSNINKLSARIRFGGVDQCLIDSGTLTEGYHKFAFRYRENDCEFFVDGVSVGTDTIVSIPTGLNTIRQYIGSSTNPFVGGTKQLAYFPTALTDSECIALTTL